MTPNNDLLALAEKAEQASGPDRELMCAAFRAINPEISSGAWDAIDAWDAAYDRFCGMLDAGAHESAAMTLVPESADAGGERYSLEQWNENGVHPAHVRASAWVAGAARVYAATPGLALTAACLRALSNSPEEKEG